MFFSVLAVCLAYFDVIKHKSGFDNAFQRHLAQKSWGEAWNTIIKKSTFQNNKYFREAVCFGFSRLISNSLLWNITAISIHHNVTTTILRVLAAENIFSLINGEVVWDVKKPISWLRGGWGWVGAVRVHFPSGSGRVQRSRFRDSLVWISRPSTQSRLLIRGGLSPGDR